MEVSTSARVRAAVSPSPEKANLLKVVAAAGETTETVFTAAGSTTELAAAATGEKVTLKANFFSLLSLPSARICTEPPSATV